MSDDRVFEEKYAGEDNEPEPDWLARGWWRRRALAAERALEQIAAVTGGLYTGPDNRNDPILLRVKRIADTAVKANK